MHSVDPPSPVRMQPMAVGGPLGQEQKQQVGVAPTAPAAAEGTQTVGNGHASMQVQEDGAAVGEDPVQANASQTEGHGDGAPSADEAVDADLEKALDEGGPDFYDPQAWTQAADFIVRVHKELPDELRTEAIRSQAVASSLFERASGLITGMCCPPPLGGEVIQDEDGKSAKQ